MPGRQDAGARDHQGHAAAPAARHAAALRPARGAHGPDDPGHASRSSSSGEAEGVKTYGGILAQNAHEISDRGAAGRPARARRARHLRRSASATRSSSPTCRERPGIIVHRRSRHDARERRAAQGPDGRGRGCGGRGRRGSEAAEAREAPARARPRARAARRGRGVAAFFRFRKRHTPVDLLVAGLGNPGARYAAHASQPRLPGRGRAGSRAGTRRPSARSTAARSARCGSRTARPSRCCARWGS